ncbi:glycosyltransferase family 4 protein [Paenibacillus medicaginis]|uniref:Glycosyltransferase family 4 protein n=1 Tax=Paenibacillus medicaginis TaxID=1470560 RepID=A0ABV5C375_9BACL
MRIAIIPSSDLSYNSGSVIYAKNLFTFLHAQGHKAYLLGSKMPLDLDSDLLPYVKINAGLLEHPVIDDRTVSSVDYGKSLSGIINYLLELHEEVGLDIIHAHYGSFNSFGAYVVSGLTKIPYVVSSFGRDINLGYEHDHRIKWLIDQSFLDASRILVTDQQIKARISLMFPNASIIDKINEIPMPLDSRIFEEGTVAFKEDLPILATINSCFSPEKGISTILDAFSILIKKIPCRLLIAGQDDHPQQVHRQSLENKVKRLGIQDAVTFLGYLDRNNVGYLLKKSTLLIDARLKGNFSSVLLEAMFMNTPVITTRNEGSIKIIEHGYNGLLFEPNDASELEANLMKCLQSSNTIIEFKNNMNSWVQRNGSLYREENGLMKVLEAFQEVLREEI